MSFLSNVKPLFLGYGFQTVNSQNEEDENKKYLAQLTQIQLGMSIGELVIQSAVSNFSISGKVRIVSFLAPFILQKLGQHQPEGHYLKKSYDLTRSAITHLARVANLVSIVSAVALTASGNFFYGGTILTFMGLTYLENRKILPLFVKTGEKYLLRSIVVAKCLMSSSIVLKVATIFMMTIQFVSYLKPFDEKIAPDAEQKVVSTLAKQEVKPMLTIEGTREFDILKYVPNTNHYQFRKIPSMFTLHPPVTKVPAAVIKIDEILSHYNVNNCQTEVEVREVSKIRLCLQFLSQLEFDLEVAYLSICRLLLKVDSFPIVGSTPSFDALQNEFNALCQSVNKEDFDEKVLKDLMSKFNQNLNEASKEFKDFASFVMTKMAMMQSWSTQIREQLQPLIKEIIPPQPDYMSLLKDHHQDIANKRNDFKKYDITNPEVILSLHVLGTLQNGREEGIRSLLDGAIPDPLAHWREPLIFYIFGKEYGLQPKEIDPPLDYLNSFTFYKLFKSFINFTSTDQVDWVHNALLEGRIPSSIVLSWVEKRFVQDENTQILCEKLKKGIMDDESYRQLIGYMLLDMNMLEKM